jgi:hypothetical protein
VFVFPSNCNPAALQRSATAGGGAHALRRDDVLERDRHSFVFVDVDERQEAMQLLVPRVDRFAVGGAQLGAGDFAAV